MSEPSKAWIYLASDLASMAMARLVNRTDRWGGHYADADGSVVRVTMPPVHKIGRMRLTRSIIERHYAATATDNVIGLHSGSPGSNSTARWLAIDIDAHPGDDADPELNLRAALHWYYVLLALGLHPLLTSSNGRGGYHLWLILTSLIPLAEAYRLARCLVRDFADWGLPREPEAFPKQPVLTASPRKPGSWLRLPGRHHKSDYWSQVWDTHRERWLDGIDAVNSILSHDGDDVAPLVRAAGNWQVEVPRPTLCRRMPAPTVEGGTPYGLAALRREAEAVAAAPVLTRNDSLNKAAFRIGQLAAAGHLDAAGAAMVLHAAAEAAGLDAGEIPATIRSGMRAGLAKPRMGVPL